MIGSGHINSPLSYSHDLKTHSYGPTSISTMLPLIVEVLTSYDNLS